MYKKVDTKLEFVKNELEIMEFWAKKQTFKKSLEKNKGNKIFSFYEGPPTANGMPHIGHPLTRAMKDVIPRFKTMQGYYVPRMAGWDTHGLPVELEVEKQIGSTGKQDIEKFGVDKFILQCKESVWKYKKIWENITERLGYWVDMAKPYITYSNDYIESVFWALSQMNKMGLIYHGHKVVPYCPRCGTSLSKMEVEQNYITLKENSIYVKFRTIKDKNTYFLVWTTTPWTLPSNIALCVNPTQNYCIVEQDGMRFIMLEALVSKLFAEPKIVERMKGSDLENQQYEPIFQYVKDKVKNGYFVTMDNFVTVEDGTGIVHIAPAFGADDYEVGKKYNLPVIQLINDEGKFTQEATDYVGLKAKSADKLIIERLQKEGKLFKILPFEHSYPHCWRCNTPLLYYAKTTWFVETSKIKDRLVKNNKSVNWLPQNIKTGRMGNFLENNVDWGISRTRFWGTPLPFWVCECGNFHVVGSKTELEKLSGKKITDLHKPEIDEITIPCDKCGKTMVRTPEVLDCWFDSGSMPFAQYHYPFENKELFEKTFPADYIAEGLDQTRGWFYSLQAISSILFNKSPYKTCIALGLINDKNGQKMSKSKGNGIDPWTILNKYGADALRWYFYNSCSPGQPLSFNEENLIELQRKTFGTLWNVYAFYVLYAQIDNFDPTKHDISTCSYTFMDKWLLSEFNALVNYVTKCLESFDMQNASKKITEFIDVLSNWYIRRSRERFWASGKTENKISAFSTLYEVLCGLVKLMAPFAPFITENIYQNIVCSVNKNAPESVHLCEYPVANEKLVNKTLNLGMNEVLKIVSLGRSARNMSGIKNRQPLEKAYVCTSKPFHLKKELVDLALNELNVEKLEVMQDASKYVTFELKPQLKTVGPKYGKHVNAIKEHLQKCTNEQINILNSGKSIQFNLENINVVLGAEDVIVLIKNKEGFVSESDGDFTVVLNTTLTPDLIAKGYVREIISHVQNLRKDSGLEVTDHIVIGIQSAKEVCDAVKNAEKEICANTLANKITYESKQNFEIEFTINEISVKISISEAK
ncbi:MAG: isoleucine--tRNA ligase [Clostridia bacterium]